MIFFKRKTGFSVLCVSLAGALLVSGCRSRFSEDDIVARVGDVVLNRDMMNKQMVWEGMTSDQESQFVERWIDRELLYQAALKQGLTRTEELTFELELIEKEYQIQKLLERTYTDKIKISDEEQQQYYEKNQDLFRVEEEDIRLFHILVDSEQKARMVLQEIRTGRPFQEIAREQSTGLFREKGGDLGYVKKDDLIPQLARSAFYLKENEVSPIIMTEHGYHILKVIKKRSKGDVRDFDDVRDEILRRIRVNKERMVYYDLLYNLRDKVNVSVSVDASPENQPDSVYTDAMID